MPLYQYRCESGHVHERREPMIGGDTFSERNVSGPVWIADYPVERLDGSGIDLVSGYHLFGMVVVPGDVAARNTFPDCPECGMPSRRIMAVAAVRVR